MSNRINHAMILFYSFCVSMAFSQVTFTRVTTLSTYLTSDETVRLEPVNLGDINEDGYPDLGCNNAIERTQFNPTVGGVLGLYYGGTHFDTQFIPLLWDEVGFPVIGGFDFNGDGYGDLAVAGLVQYNSNSDVQPELPQTVKIYAGDGTGFDPVPLITFEPDLYDWWWFYWMPGYTLASGDFNGDGYDDLLVGAFQDLFDGRGRAFIHLGRSSIDEPLDSTPDLELEGLEESEMFGYSTAQADLNNDGFSDYVIGGMGTIYIYSGGQNLSAQYTAAFTPELPPEGSNMIGAELLLLPSFNEQTSIVLTYSVCLDSPQDCGYPVGIVVDSSLTVVDEFIIDNPFREEYSQLEGGFCTGYFDGDTIPDVIIVGVRYTSETQTDTGGLFLYLNPREPLDFLEPDTVLGPINNIAVRFWQGAGNTIESIDLNNDGYDELAVRTLDAEGNYQLEIYTFNELLLGLEGESDGVSRPTDFRLLPNYPNPFNGTTTVQFNLPVDGLVELQVYDITGKLVKTLVSGEQTAGAHVVTWMGDNDRGQMTASGVYHLALTATETETEKQHRLHQKALLLK